MSLRKSRVRRGTVLSRLADLERGDSFFHVVGVDLSRIVGDKPHSTQNSGRGHVQGGIVVDGQDHQGGGR